MVVPSVMRAGEKAPVATDDDEPEDIDERTRQQYLAISQYLLEHELHDTLHALKSETGITYIDNALPVASVLEGCLDMFATTVGATVGEQTMDEDSILQLDRGVCCTGLVPSGPSNALSANVTAVAWAVTRFNEMCALVSTADRRIRVLGSSGETLAELEGLPSPPIAVDVAPCDLGGVPDATQEAIAATMGGEALLLRLRRPSTDGSGEWSLEICQQFKDHTKHVTSCLFAPSAGEGVPSAHFVTTSRDHSACIYARDVSTEQFKLVGTVRLSGEITSCWANSRVVVLAARDSHELHYWDVDGGGADGQEPKENMRANMNVLGDSVCSFAVLSLACSPDGKLIAACTDKSRIIVMKTFTKIQLRNLYGCQINEFDMPSVCFSLDRTFIYATSALPQPRAADRGGGSGEQSFVPMCGEVTIFELKTGEVVLKLPCHEKSVRSMRRHPFSEALVTGAFDKAVRYWS